MSSKGIVTTVAAVAVAAFCLGQVFAQEPGEKPAGAPMMPPWMKLTQEHKDLAASVGTFDVAGEIYTAPGAPAMKMAGTSHREMVLDGRYLVEMFKSSWMGQPFEGHLLQGYDTVRKEYVSIWVDSSSPVPSIARGKKGDDGRIVMYSEDPDMTPAGTLVKMKSVIEHKDDAMVMTAYKVTDKGDQMHMKLTYTRKKEKADGGMK
jgi:hypothetical protein